MKRIVILMAAMTALLLTSYGRTPEERLEIIKKAHEGNAEAQWQVGFMHETGEGVTQSKEEATKWYMKSADNGFADARFCIGKCYMLGLGVEQNEELGLEWFERAAAQNETSALNQLAYAKGKFFKPNKSKALSLISKNIEIDPENPNWYDSKGEIYAIFGDYENAKVMYEKVLKNIPKILREQRVCRA